MYALPGPFLTIAESSRCGRNIRLLWTSTDRKLHEVGLRDALVIALCGQHLHRCDAGGSLAGPCRTENPGYRAKHHELAEKCEICGLVVTKHHYGAHRILSLGHFPRGNWTDWRRSADPGCIMLIRDPRDMIAMSAVRFSAVAFLTAYNLAEVVSGGCGSRSHQNSSCRERNRQGSCCS